MHLFLPTLSTRDTITLVIGGKQSVERSLKESPNSSYGRSVVREMSDITYHIRSSWPLASETSSLSLFSSSLSSHPKHSLF